MSNHTQPSRGRPRRAQTDEQIIRAAREILRDHGPEAVNVASVSAHSGVARTTIYRRYPEREALLGAALRSVTERGRPPEGLTIPQRVEWVLRATEAVFSHGIGPGGIAAVLADSEPEFTAALRGALRADLQPVLEQIGNDVEGGRLIADLDPDFVLNLILGAYLAEALRNGLPDDRWRTRTTALLSKLITADQ